MKSSCPNGDLCVWMTHADDRGINEKGEIEVYWEKQKNLSLFAINVSVEQRICPVYIVHTTFWCNQLSYGSQSKINRLSMPAWHHILWHHTAMCLGVCPISVLSCKPQTTPNAPLLICIFLSTEFCWGDQQGKWQKSNIKYPALLPVY